MTREYRWKPGGAFGSNVTESNTNGVYAFRTQNLALQHAYENRVVSHDPIVVGSVLLSGVVIEHQHGYRAEFARIEQLVLVLRTFRSFLLFKRNPSLSMVQEYYGCLFIPIKMNLKDWIGMNILPMMILTLSGLVIWWTVMALFVIANLLGYRL